MPGGMRGRMPNPEDSLHRRSGWPNSHSARRSDAVDAGCAFPPPRFSHDAISPDTRPRRAPSSHDSGGAVATRARSAPRAWQLAPRRALSLAAASWFVVATLGQWAFAGFTLAFHAPPTLRGDFLALNERPHITGWVPGDTLGNAQLLMHVFLGALVTLAGMLQLIPSLRRRWPSLHRWNGRVFLSAAAIATFGGFYLTYVRGSQLGGGSTASITVDGVLILVFATLAWRSAMARDFAEHRRHALRAYLLVNGVWFLRLGMMLTGLLLAPLGIEMRYDSAIFVVVNLASWMLPLALLQLYLVAERSPRPELQYGVAGVLTLATFATAAGSLAAVMFMWWPRL
jgi:hypothetical protein